MQLGCPQALMTDLKIINDAINILGCPQSPYDWFENINDAIVSLNESDLLHVMLYGRKKFDNNMNMSILTATIKFIKDTGRFDQSLF